MAFLNFAENQLITVMDTSDTIDFGAFQAEESMEIAHIRAAIYVQGTASAGGSETLQLRLHTSTDLTASYAQSNVVTLDSIITDIGGANQGVIGWARFDFSRENINKELNYQVSAVATNYTRNADTFYIGFLRDFPFPIYSGGLTPPTFYGDHLLGMQIFGYK